MSLLSCVRWQVTCTKGTVDQECGHTCYMPANIVTSCQDYAARLHLIEWPPGIREVNRLTGIVPVCLQVASQQGKYLAKALQKHPMLMHRSPAGYSVTGRCFDTL